MKEIKVGMKFKGGHHNPKMIAEVVKVIDNGKSFQSLYPDGCYTYEFTNNVKFIKQNEKI